MRSFEKVTPKVQLINKLKNTRKDESKQFHHLEKYNVHQLEVLIDYPEIKIEKLNQTSLEFTLDHQELIDLLVEEKYSESINDIFDIALKLNADAAECLWRNYCRGLDPLKLVDFFKQNKYKFTTDDQFALSALVLQNQVVTNADQQSTKEIFTDDILRVLSKCSAEEKLALAQSHPEYELRLRTLEILKTQNKSSSKENQKYHLDTQSVFAVTLQNLKDAIKCYGETVQLGQGPTKARL